MKLDGSWPERLNMVIGQQLGHFRKIRGLTAAQLAERCTELGLPISRSKIANMENGRARQEGVSVAEVVIMAEALSVPPILLVYPVGREEMTEVLPGREVSSWDAALWFGGEQPLPTKSVTGRYVLAASDDFPAWHQGAAPVAYYREERQLLAELSRPREPGTEKHIRDLEEQLRQLRRSMRRAGVRTGQLTDNLRHIDDEAF